MPPKPVDHMARRAPHHHTTTFLIFSAFFISASSPAPSISIYTSCSPVKYPPQSPFQSTLSAVISTAVDATVRSSYGSFASNNISSSPPDSAVYALYHCRKDLKPGDCSRCVINAVTQIRVACSLSRGGAIQLDGCYFRYENSDFIGNLELGVMYVKCSSKKNVNEAEFFRHRDEVLAELAATEGFSVTSSRNVHGVALCTGDLSSANCSACMTTAVGKMKVNCGYVVAAEVFLPKCYARYWASGIYSDSSGNDDVGKTVAIIAGTVAGVVVVIVFLSFCRRAMAG